MAKKTSKKYVIHHRLEKPVHNVVGYGVLLLLAIVVYILVDGMMKMNAY